MKTLNLLTSCAIISGTGTDAYYKVSELLLSAFLDMLIYTKPKVSNFVIAILT